MNLKIYAFRTKHCFCFEIDKIKMDQPFGIAGDHVRNPDRIIGCIFAAWWCALNPALLVRLQATVANKTAMFLRRFIGEAMQRYA